MALTKRNPTAAFEQTAATPAAATPAAQATPAVQSEPDPVQANPAAAQAGHTQPTPTPTAATPSAATALVIKQPGAMAALNEGSKTLDSLKDALRVDWDTLPRLKMGQGRIFIDNAAKTSLGEWITFNLLSYQDNWLVSPGSDSDEAKQLAAYSDDGKYLKGSDELIVDYITRLKGMGFENARSNQRLVLVAELTDCDKDATVDDGMLFQIDLPPTSRSQFSQYRAQTALDIARGRAQPTDATHLKGTASVQQQRGKSNEYTLLSFTRAPIQG